MMDLVERLRAYTNDSTVSPRAVELCLEAADALSRAGAAEGWKLVPVEPNDEIVRAIYRGQPNAIQFSAYQAWTDGIAASPPAIQSAPSVVKANEEREAFSAGWRTNANGEQPEGYLTSCEAVDFAEYKKLGLTEYLSTLQVASAPSLPASALTALKEASRLAGVVAAGGQLYPDEARELKATLDSVIAEIGGGK